MLHSIRTRLFMAFIGLLILYMIVMQLISVFLMDNILVLQSQFAMEKMYHEISEEVQNGKTLTDLLDEREYRTGMFVSAVTPDGQILTNHPVNNPSPEHPRQERPWVEPVQELRAKADSNEIFGVFGAESTKTPFRTVVLAAKLNDGNVLVIERPMGSIRDAGQSYRRFLMISGGVILLLGSVLIYGLAGRVTAPLFSLDRTARRIAELDFSERVSVKSKDEIGDLASSIQTMSDNLQQTLEELTAANSQLQDDIDKERKLDAQRRRFISSVSHELRTPLSMVQGYADGLKHGIAQTPEDVENYCEIIVDETRKMSQLIRDMLNLSAYDNGAFPVRLEDFDINGLLSQIAYRLEPKAEELNLRIDFESDGEHTFTGDPLRIEQSVVNLLNNALRHTVSSGRIVLSLKEIESKIAIEVFNPGPPMDEDLLMNCWEPFYKGKATDVTRDGYGLGLAIVKAIIEAHKGTVSVENRDLGVSFRILLPTNSQLLPVSLENDME